MGGRPCRGARRPVRLDRPGRLWRSSGLGCRASAATSTTSCRDCASLASPPTWRNGSGTSTAGWRCCGTRSSSPTSERQPARSPRSCLCFLASTECRALEDAVLRRPSYPRILPHRTRDRLRPDVRLRPGLRSDARHDRHRHSHHWRSGQAVLRSRRECEYAAGRRPDRDRRPLPRDYSLRRLAPDPLKLRQLHAAALRDRCSARRCWASSEREASAKS